MGVDLICCGRPGAVGVDGVAEFLGGLEEGDSLGWDVYLFSCFGVSPYAGVALAGAEAAKTTDFNLVSGFECPDDGVEEGIHDDFAIATG